MTARGDLVSVDDPVIGPVRQQAPYPRLTKNPTPVPSGAPRLGEHNHEVWCDLVGLSDDRARRPRRARRRLSPIVAAGRSTRPAP